MARPTVTHLDGRESLYTSYQEMEEEILEGHIRSFAVVCERDDGGIMTMIDTGRAGDKFALLGGTAMLHDHLMERCRSRRGEGG